MTANSYPTLDSLTFGDNVRHAALRLPESSDTHRKREIEAVLDLLANRPLVEVARLSQGELYKQLKDQLIDSVGMFTGSLLHTVRQITLAANRQLDIARLQLVNRTTASNYKSEELANMSLLDLLRLVVAHPHTALYVEDIVAQRVKRVKGDKWVVPVADTDTKQGVPRIHLRATLRNVGRYDGVAEVTDLPSRDGVPVQPISFRDAFTTCDVF